MEFILELSNVLDTYKNSRLHNDMLSSAMVAWFVKASVFQSVNSAPSANGGSNTAWKGCIDHLNLKEFVAIQIARPRVLFGGFTIQAPGISC